MTTQINLGENEGIDADGIEDVSYEPSEKTADTPEEKSDAQRIADGEIEVPTSDDEIFVAPDSVFTPGGEEKPSEESGEEPEEKKEPEKEPEKKESKKESEKPGEKPEKKQEKKPPASAPDPVQKRINKLTREKYDAMRRAEEAEEKAKKALQELEELRLAKEKAEIDSQKPNIDDFDDVDDYHIALGRWAAKAEIHEAKAQAKEPPVIKETQDAKDPREKIINLGQETYDDFLEKVSSIPISKEMFDAVQDSEHAHEILYYMGQNPEIARNLFKEQSVISIAREVGRIESKFVDEEPEVVANEGGNDTEKPKPSSAPKPVKPVGGSGKVARKLEDLSLAEYYESRGYTRDGMRKRP